VRVLVLGGARFIGRHIVERLVKGGHQVTTLSRGTSNDELPSPVERLRGDRDAADHGVDALAGRMWDACVDVSGYIPQQVRPVAEALRGRSGRYVFISTVSVYEDGGPVPVLETHPLLPAAAEEVTEITGETYGPLKVTCEQIIDGLYGQRATILRPQIVAGPHDPTGRHTYWVQRATETGQMLAPGNGTDHVQVVDVRDIATFVDGVLERDVGGVFNMAGPRLSWSQFIDVLDPVPEVVWVDDDIIEDAGLTFVELPLYRSDGGERSSLMHVSRQRASDAGLTLTGAAATARDVRTWLQDHPVKAALDPAVERRLIARARERRSWR
jgi:2'-hydroxyisoflavone reductase